MCKMSHTEQRTSEMAEILRKGDDLIVRGEQQELTFSLVDGGTFAQFAESVQTGSGRLISPTRT